LPKLVPLPPPGFDDLSIDEKIDYLQSLWDRIAATPDAIPVPDWHREIIDERGGSPFWDGVAGRFFGMTFQEADYFNAINGNQFIADLMPKHPVYVAMLDDDARAVIGLPHPSGRAAMTMLEAEGFAFEGYVDIFDGGPTMTARTNKVRSIAEARPGRVTAIDLDIGERALLATGELASFRACYGMRELASDGAITIDEQAARALGVGEGDEVWSIAR